MKKHIVLAEGVRIHCHHSHMWQGNVKIANLNRLSIAINDDACTAILEFYGQCTGYLIFE